MTQRCLTLFHHQSASQRPLREALKIHDGPCIEKKVVKLADSQQRTVAGQVLESLGPTLCGVVVSNYPGFCKTIDGYITLLGLLDICYENKIPLLDTEKGHIDVSTPMARYMTQIDLAILWYRQECRNLGEKPLANPFAFANKFIAENKK